MSGCIISSLGMSVGRGLFVGNPDAEIGATRGDDGTLAFGAGMQVPSRQSSSGGCGLPAGSHIEGVHVGFPDCGGQLDPTSAKGKPIYRFDCRTMPVKAGSGWKVLSYVVRGFIKLQ
jgi:hypothetical protein